MGSKEPILQLQNLSNFLASPSAGKLDAESASAFWSFQVLVQAYPLVVEAELPSEDLLALEHWSVRGSQMEADCSPVLE